jgi:hypothetical protein
MKCPIRAALMRGIRGYHMHQRTGRVDASERQLRDIGAASSAELELELIQTQMTQKPMLRAEGECACVAQKARAKIRGRGWPSPSQRARNLWVVRTLEMHRERRRQLRGELAVPTRI